jgi:hypothetical protein
MCCEIEPSNFVQIIVLNVAAVGLSSTPMRPQLFGRPHRMFIVDRIPIQGSSRRQPDARF